LSIYLAMNRNYVIQVAPALRNLKNHYIGINSRIKYFLNRKRYNLSNGKTLVLLSLGGGKGSPFVARAVSKLGFNLVVAAPTFPRYEAQYANLWIKSNVLTDYESLKTKIEKQKPIAVLVEQRNILLPVKARLNTDLNLVDYGNLSHKTSNSKIELRLAIDRAKKPNIPWALLKDYQSQLVKFPFVLKPEKGTGSRGITIIEKESDLKIAFEKLKSLEADETVGGRIMVEGMIKGRQFDVEGVYFNGDFYALSVTEEHYEATSNALPSSWYLFSPPIDKNLRTKLISAAQTFTQALGVRNGAFHCEMRVSESGDIYAIDYSNRMGYPLLVSECSGYSFPELYVKVMAGERPELNNLKENTVFQRFVRSQKEYDSYSELMKAHPRHVVQKNILGSYVGGVKTYARIALKHKSFDDLKGMLNDYNLIPKEWENIYNI